MGRVLLELEPDGVASLERALGLEVDDGDNQDKLAVGSGHVDMLGRAHELGHLDGALERTLLALVGTLILIFVTLPLWAGTGRRWADRIPPWSVYRLLVGVSWLHTVATLMSVGQKPVDILAAMLADHSTTPYLRNILRRINNHVGRGSNLGDALEKTGLRWPSPELVEELQAYSNLPGFGEQIRAIAADWLTDGINLIVQAARALNIICILMVGGLVILMVTGITSIQQQIAIGIGGY